METKLKEKSFVVTDNNGNYYGKYEIYSGYNKQYIDLRVKDIIYKNWNTYEEFLSDFSSNIVKVADILNTEIKEKFGRKSYCDFLYNDEIELNVDEIYEQKKLKEIPVEKEETPNLIESGKTYIGENNVEYLVIEIKNNSLVNVAILKAEDEYVVANNIKLNEKNNIYWDHGSYYQNLLNATIKFNTLTLRKEKQINSLMGAFKQLPAEIFFSSVLEYEMNEDKEEINELDLKKLEVLYDEFISTDELKLISEEISDRAEELDWKNIEQDIIDYLKEEGIDVNKVTNERINKLVQDVLDSSIENNIDSYSLIYIDDYLDGAVEELLEEQNQDNEEEDEI